MGQCVTLNVGNEGAVAPIEGGGDSKGGGTNISSNVGGGDEEEEEEEEEEGLCGCIEEGNCLPCL